MTPLKEILHNAIRIRCPRCGQGKLFFAWAELVEKCEKCRLKIRVREPDTWFFMYMSTAAITGIFVTCMLLLPAPKNQTIAALLIGMGAIGIFFLTTPLRKSLALALEYFTDSRSEHSRYPDE
ncbi:MAG: hypothetical protein ACKN9V_05330 [Pseudomonadota bacterium]